MVGHRQDSTRPLRTHVLLTPHHIQPLLLCGPHSPSHGCFVPSQTKKNSCWEAAVELATSFSSSSRNPEGSQPDGVPPSQGRGERPREKWKDVSPESAAHPFVSNLGWFLRAEKPQAPAGTQRRAPGRRLPRRTPFPYYQSNTNSWELRRQSCNFSVFADNRVILGWIGHQHRVLDLRRHG